MCRRPSIYKGFRVSNKGVDQDIDSGFWGRPSDADSNCPKMRQSQRRVEEGGFEGGGVGFEASDLDYDQLAAAAVRAIEDWLDKDTVEFEPERG